MNIERIKACLIPALALMIIGGVTTAALAGVNLLTQDAIETRTRESENAARRQVLTADTFEEKELTTDNGTITYCEAQTDGRVVGYVFTVTTSGKSSGLTVMTGIRTDGTLSGVAVTADNETAGYVDKVIADGLFTRIVAANGTGVDGTSQATRTSKGIFRGVDTDRTYFEQITKEGAAS